MMSDSVSDPGDWDRDQIWGDVFHQIQNSDEPGNRREQPCAIFWPLRLLGRLREIIQVGVEHLPTSAGDHFQLLGCRFVIGPNYEPVICYADGSHSVWRPGDVGPRDRPRFSLAASTPPVSTTWGGSSDNNRVE